MYQPCPNHQCPDSHPKYGQSATPCQCHFHPWYTQIGPQRRNGTAPYKKREAKQDHKRTAEEERKRKEEESALLCKSCVPHLLSTKPNPPLTDPPVPVVEEKEKRQKKKKKNKNKNKTITKRWCNRLLCSRHHICGQL